MHIDLLMVGAHNGSKDSALILAASRGSGAILVEPVPFLFAMLKQRYGGCANVHLLNMCVAEMRGSVDFYSPSPSANTIVPYGDQLGSMSGIHAIGCNPELSKHIEKVAVEALTFTDIIERFDVSSIDTLLIDTEGYDAVLLPTFPFDRIKPRTIVFEFKHADGLHRVGKNLGKLLILLDALGYQMSIMDPENCVAKLAG